jgi:hypothetical protein
MLNFTRYVSKAIALLAGMALATAALAAPTVTITSPASGTVISGSSVNIAATVSAAYPITQVIFYRDSWTQLGVVAASPYRYSVDSNTLGNGSHNFFAVAYDSSGASSASAVVTVNVQNSTTPTVSIISPANNATISGSPVPITASVSSASAVTQVVFYRDSWIQLGTSTTAPYQFNLDSRTLANGTHSLFATAKNSAGLSGASSVITANVQNGQASSCTPISPPTLSGFDPLPIVQSAKIPYGNLATGYLVGKDGGVLNWYFANVGLLGFVDRMPTDVKNYMNLYLSRLNASYKIADLYFDDIPVNYNHYVTHANGSGELSDSDDSYAATFLSLANRYYRVTCDTQWVTANLAKLKAIADYNLVNSQWPNGLVHVYQNANSYYGAYTEDNAEVYKGLMDFASLLNAVNDSSSTKYSTAAGKIATALQNKMYFSSWPTSCQNPPGFATLWSSGDFNAMGTCLNIPLAMYPDGITQIFPQVFGVPLPQGQYDAGWNFLNAKFPNFYVAKNGLPPYPNYDDPWTILGYAAALRGNTSIAQQMQTLTTTTYNADPARVHINDWGFYERSRRYLQGFGNY